MSEIFDEIKEKGIPFDNHYSDLYIPVTPETREIVNRLLGENHTLISTFVNQVEGGLWYDLPFKYAPYWEKKFGEKYE